MVDGAARHGRTWLAGWLAGGVRTYVDEHDSVPSKYVDVVLDVDDDDATKLNVRWSVGVGLVTLY